MKSQEFFIFWQDVPVGSKLFFLGANEENKEEKENRLKKLALPPICAGRCPTLMLVGLSAHSYRQNQISPSVAE
jgi:hypothetical protein